MDASMRGHLYLKRESGNPHNDFYLGYNTNSSPNSSQDTTTWLEQFSYSTWHIRDPTFILAQVLLPPATTQDPVLIRLWP